MSFQHVTFVQILRLCESIVSSNHGHLFLRAVFNDLKESMGPTFVKNKWHDSGLQLKHWMDEDQVCDLPPLPQHNQVKKLCKQAVLGIFTCFLAGMFPFICIRDT